MCAEFSRFLITSSVHEATPLCVCVHEPDESVAGCRLAATLVRGGLQNTSSLLHAHSGAGSAATGACDDEDFYTCKFAFLSLFLCLMFYIL